MNPTGQSKSKTISTRDGESLAAVATPGAQPTVVFLGGFMSDMTGTKATALEEYCRNRGQAFVRFDYRGHGQSSGAFAAGTIGLWAEDVLTVIDAVTEGPLVLVGSSMGGWIMLLAALSRRDRVTGLLGIAPAPDFTDRMQNGELTPDQIEVIKRDGKIEIPSDYDDGPYTITRALLEDGSRQRVLDKPIHLSCKVRLLHGMQDNAVPWSVSSTLLSTITGDDVEVTFIKNGDHRLSEPADIQRLYRTLDDLLQV